MTPTLNKRALLALGYTPALVASILGEPDEIESHTKGMRRWVEHLYSRERVVAGMQDPRFLAVLEAREKRKAKSAERLAAIPTRYADWRAALPEACAGLFSLNRYAKHRACSALHKHEIYQLKNDLIEALYRQGYCTASWIHRMELPRQTCRECAGDGEWCDHCGGSGVWRDRRILEFWCFRFMVVGRAYCWHQPRGLVSFQPVESLPPQQWQWQPGEKPVSLARAKFAQVKELISWVISQAQAEERVELIPFECFSEARPEMLSMTESI